ncbi:hypothetical protein FACS1894111_02450 [Clostridia bacterium]|nr:hypothetical protein FACS1894111_02450 [Clostridia bacterium]
MAVTDAATGPIKPIENGKVTGNNDSGTTRKAGGTMGKDAFLQLLVAQMKYQDPLEPASNTEYVAQLATFSSLEEMQNLNTAMKEGEAANLVGKQVIMKVTDPVTGAESFVSGKVNYVMKENGKMVLSVGNESRLFPIDDLDTVVDEEYLDAATLAKTFEKMMESLPGQYTVKLGDKGAVELARKAFDSMTNYQKGFVDPSYEEKLKLLEEAIAAMEKAAGGGTDAGSDSTDATDSTDGTDSAGGEADGTDGTDSTGGEAEGTGSADSPAE